MVETEVLLGGEPRPRPHDDVLGRLARDRRGLVLRLGVYHDHLVGPGHRVQALADPLLLVERDHDDGEPRARHPSRPLTPVSTGSGGSAAIVVSGAVSVRWPLP